MTEATPNPTPNPTQTPEATPDRTALLKIRDALAASPISFDSSTGALKDAIAEALLEVRISPFGEDVKLVDW